MSTSTIQCAKCGVWVTRSHTKAASATGNASAAFREHVLYGHPKTN